MLSEPKVSVIIPTYKRPLFLERAIRSVQTQTYNNIEIIVVDDNNIGDEYRLETENVMKNIKDPRVIYIKHNINRNGAVARNTGINYSSGEYISFLDDDDEFLPDKILNQVKRMENLDNSWGACYTSYKKFNSNDNVQICFENREGELFLEGLMRSLYIGSGSNIFVRKSVIEKIGGFDESFIRNQDLEFLVRVLKEFKMAFVNICGLLVHYEIRDTKRTYQQLKEIDKYYIEKFKNTIDSLNNKDRKKVYTMIALEDFRNSISGGELIQGFYSLMSKKINPMTFMRYILYILNRYLMKRSYGFRI
ncbi:glycosyltransferase [Rossellomorea marisflavi]|uniref:glycosyltransferase family 2 protein n=1 Tax=Rossellomorea marisflavi TaxID=189381 RepID=UPI00279B0367|nr:glycosyltransferase family 2 protein [Rossellomorea marisflavi]UTE73407.1 glycosyltransferase [Rossellomorea marisflavi]